MEISELRSECLTNFTAANISTPLIEQKYIRRPKEIENPENHVLPNFVKKSTKSTRPFKDLYVKEKMSRKSPLGT